ncbi:MAG: DUF4595 domain-containing protein [Duncaniella sp.]|nr:DUF4595 domain-containing protein [Duncaniella sp.]
MTAYGQTLASLKYDDNGRVTRVKAEDLIINISYSPLKITFVDYEDVTEWTDIKTNSAGYITSAKLTEEDEYGVDTWRVSVTYDRDNHVTSTYDGEENSSAFEWEGTRLKSMSMFDDKDSYRQTLTYSDVENKAGNVSLMWCDFSIYWLTGLFGEVPGYLPSKIYDSYEEDTVNLGYKLNSNGSIAKEQVSVNGSIQMVIDYNYTSSRASVSEAGASADAFNVFNKKSSGKHRIFHKR